MIELKGITKRFGEITLFNDLCLTINDGEYVVIMGPSGSGKTTLLNIIGGLEKVDKGEVTVDDFSLTGKKNLRRYYKEKVGFLFQNFALVENKTVMENLNMVHKSARTEVSIDEALKMVGMYDKKNETVYKLSGGEQQRVAAARLFLKKCDIILADEPTGSLDYDNGMKIIDILHWLNDSGKTVILVTHDERVLKSGDRLIKL